MEPADPESAHRDESQMEADRRCSKRSVASRRRRIPDLNTGAGNPHCSGCLFGLLVRLPTRSLFAEETEDGYTAGGSYVDLAVDDEWSDEFVAITEGVAAAGCL